MISVTILISLYKEKLIKTRQYNTQALMLQYKIINFIENISILIYLVKSHKNMQILYSLCQTNELGATLNQYTLQKYTFSVLFYFKKWVRGLWKRLLDVIAMQHMQMANTDRCINTALNNACMLGYH